MIGIGLRLWRHRDQAVQLVRQAQELAAIIMGPAGAQPQHAFDVKWVQQSLNVLRNAKLDVDGDYGDKTKAAIKKYQQDKQLEPDGWVGVITLAELEKDMAERG
jgi:peptidoglycan hydrolase-like protein with peptidoglycan-binding domain